jgi:hypothetical protein
MRRRTVLGSALAAVPVAAAAVARPAAAQEATPAGDLAGHPLVGTWAVMSPGGVVPQTHGPDGSVVAAFPPNYLDPALGLTFQGTALGRWEADGERGARFTALQALSGPDGTYVGTFLLAAGMEVGEDGQSWSGSGETRIVVRDAANTVVVDEVLPVEPVVTATRVGATAESVVLPVVAAGAGPAIGTPTA